MGALDMFKPVRHPRQGNPAPPWPEHTPATVATAAATPTRQLASTGPAAVHPDTLGVANTNTNPAIVPTEQDNGHPHQLGPTGIPYRTVHDDMRDLHQLFVRHLTQWNELVELLRKPNPVWVRPSDRIATPTGVCSAPQTGGNNSWHPAVVVNPILPGCRATILNIGATTLYMRSVREVGVGFGEWTAAAPQDAWPILPGAGLSIDTSDGLCLFTWGAGVVGVWAAVVETFEL